MLRFACRKFLSGLCISNLYGRNGRVFVVACTRVHAMCIRTPLGQAWQRSDAALWKFVPWRRMIHKLWIVGCTHVCANILAVLQASCNACAHVLCVTYMQEGGFVHVILCGYYTGLSISETIFHSNIHENGTGHQSSSSSSCSTCKVNPGLYWIVLLLGSKR